MADDRRSRSDGRPRSKGGSGRTSAGKGRGGGGKPRSGEARGGDARRGGGRSTRRGPDTTPLSGPPAWGRIARRAATGVPGGGDETPARPPRRRREDDERPPDSLRPAGALPDEAALRASAAGAVARGREEPVRERSPLPGRPPGLPDPEVAIGRRLDEPAASKAVKRLRTAGVAFEAERFDDARRAIAPLVKQTPEVAEVRELAGLIAYRRGDWADAVDHLEAFRSIAGSAELHPVLADCHRALGHWGDVDLLWEELGAVSPAPDIVTEGRIVTAGARADRGDLDAAIRLLEKGWKIPKKAKDHHLRRAYALADLYDRAGRAPRARELFRWVESQAPDLADVGARVRALG